MRAADKAAYESVASDFCCVCGHTGRIELHHVIRRSQGGSTIIDNLLPLCVLCHSKTDGDSLWFVDEGDGIRWVNEVPPSTGICVFADPNRDAPSPHLLSADDGEMLAELERMAVDELEQANVYNWRASRHLREAYRVFRDNYGATEGMARYKEWASELRDSRYRLRPIAPSTARDMAHTAALPDVDDIACMTLRERKRLLTAMGQDADYEEARDDIYALSMEDFEAKHLGKPTWIERRTQ